MKKIKERNNQKSIRQARFQYILLTSFIALIIIPTATAIQGKIKIKDSFSINETIQFNYFIKAEQSQKIKFTPFVSCPSVPQPFFNTKTEFIGLNGIYRGLYKHIKIKSDFKPQNCTALLIFEEPIEKTIRKNFTINTEPHIDLDIHTCMDQKCEDRRSIFATGEKIWIEVQSTPEKIDSEVFLLMPSGNEKKIDLPHQFSPKETGIYQIDATGSKDGFQSASDNLKFEVLESHVKLSQPSYNFPYLTFILTIAILIILLFSFVAFKKWK